MPSLPSASTSCEGVAPGVSISVALQPPRSLSLLSSDCQLGGAQKSLKTGPAWTRIIDSPPLHGSAALILHQRGKRRAVIASGRIQIHRPIGIGGTGVHVQRINEMLLGRAINHRIEEKRPGSKIDDRRTGDAERVDVTARQP